jgi:hypothetical protein
MAHFAELDQNNVVLRVLVVPDNQEHRGQEYLAEELGLGGVWMQTSYNTRKGKHIRGGTPFRKNFALKGYIYDQARDAFRLPRPIYIDGIKWELDEETCTWVRVK